ncbi:MAG: T9SS type A sorting domain-containing protein, partial [Bacteroidetes bacterium]|nr:T9SS type A sorting domain-containing protein [Bacteroidota bacterium]
VVDEPVNLKFYLAETSILELSVFDLNGKRVKLLYKGFVKSGNNQLAFSTAYLNSGIYLVVISDEKKVLTTQKFVVAN